MTKDKVFTNHCNKFQEFKNISRCLKEFHPTIQFCKQSLSAFIAQYPLHIKGNDQTQIGVSQLLEGCLSTSPIKVSWLLHVANQHSWKCWSCMRHSHVQPLYHRFQQSKTQLHLLFQDSRQCWSNPRWKGISVCCSSHQIDFRCYFWPFDMVRKADDSITLHQLIRGRHCQFAHTLWPDRASLKLYISYKFIVVYSL